MDEGFSEGVSHPSSLSADALRERLNQAEKAQRLAENRYRLLFERSLAGVYRATLDGRIVDLNESCARMFGYSKPGEARGHILQETFLAPGDFERLLRLVREHKSIGNLELELQRQDGQRLCVLLGASLLENGSEPVIEGTLIDITERKQAEDALRRSEERFRTLVEKSSDAISLVDGSGKVLYSSHAISPIFGYSLEERMGKSVFEFIHPEESAQVLHTFKKLLAQPYGSASIELRYRHKDGSWRWIEALGTNLLEDPSVQAVAINYRDITERRQLMEQLFLAQKMEAVGRLAGGVAHDFNNLLTAILGYSDMVLEKLPRGSVLSRYTSEIKRAGERAASLTRQLLAFSRLQVMSPRVLDLNVVIEEMSRMLRRVIGEDVTLTTSPGAGLERVKVDPSQVEQVILNLAVNARDAMPEGGELRIRTSNARFAEDFIAEGVRVQAGSYVALEVTDTGCGMDSETSARVFEPFFTTKEKGKGTGLGLSTVYGIVKQSGGYIWVSSEPQKGTTFKIYLPGVEEAAAPAKAADAPVQIDRGSETILLVEDETNVRELLCGMLRSKGYEVLEAARGEEALALGKNHSQPIHLIVTDMVMPQMNGRELARRLCALHPESNVLYMTGYAGNKIGAIDVLENDVAFIHKPFSAEALSQKVRSILDPA